MKCMPVALFVALSLLSCFGQNSESYLACNKKANTQADMNVCAGQEAERALGWTACLGVIDDQELSFGAGDRELIRP